MASTLYQTPCQCSLQGLVRNQRKGRTRTSRYIPRCCVQFHLDASQSGFVEFLLLVIQLTKAWSPTVLLSLPSSFSSIHNPAPDGRQHKIIRIKKILMTCFPQWASAMKLNIQVTKGLHQKKDGWTLLIDNACARNADWARK